LSTVTKRRSSERDESQEDAVVWHPETFGSFNGIYSGSNCVSDGIVDSDAGPFRSSIGFGDSSGVGCLQRNFAFPDWQYAGEAEVLALITNFDRFENTADFGGSNGFAMELENGPHQLVHGMIGGNMETNWSPADPLFWMLHTNVDRIWTIWQVSALCPSFRHCVVSSSSQE
jgi:hypothetical protein